MYTKERAAGEAAHFFNNPKTNLTYEKNLYILTFKYRAKHYANINTIPDTKKCFYLHNQKLTII